MKAIICISLMLAGFSASASCVEAFRQAYVKATVYEHASEAADLYLIKFDFDSGIELAYSEAAKLFRALGVSEVSDKTLVLQELSRLIENGALCPNGRPAGLTEAARQLRQALDAR